MERLNYRGIHEIGADFQPFVEQRFHQNHREKNMAAY